MGASHFIDLISTLPEDKREKATEFFDRIDDLVMRTATEILLEDIQRMKELLDELQEILTDEGADYAYADETIALISSLSATGKETIKALRRREKSLQKKERR